MPYERNNIRHLSAYQPGEQPHGDQVVKLNTNENPYPPHDEVLRAIRKVSEEALRRYPQPDAAAFREAAARAHGLRPQQVIATNGGDELLRLAISVFCEPQAEERGTGGIGATEPGYSLLPVLARIHQTPIVGVALDEQFAIPDDFADRMNQAGCRLAVVINPHAPSGRRESLEKLDRIARRFEGGLLIDEAYVDFAEHDSTALLQRGLQNVLLLRTLSKGYSLAGLRFGYGLGPATLIAPLDKARDSFNTDVVAQHAAVAALAHRSEIARTWQLVKAERVRLSTALTKMGFEVLPSESNFLLVRPPAAAPTARALYESLKGMRIFVRYFDQDRLRDRLRITVGTPMQNELLLEALKKMLASTTS